MVVVAGVFGFVSGHRHVHQFGVVLVEREVISDTWNMDSQT